MSSFEILSSLPVPNGTAEVYGFNVNFLKNKKLIPDTKGIVLFVHGFNSAASIWGSEKEGFVSYVLEKKFIPFVIDFSDAVSGSIPNLANHDLYLFYNFVQMFIQEQFSAKKPLPIHIVAHSMGGIITRYFLSTLASHEHYSISDIKKTNLKSVALLSVPNHGMSKSNSENFIIKMDKIIKDFNDIVGPKFSIKLADKAYYQLLSGNSIITSLLEDLETNMWKELYWMNFIAEKDIVVDYVSSYFTSEEVDFLGDNFYQSEVNATHLRNPFHSFTDSLARKINFQDKKLFNSLEIKKPDFLSYLINDPIYAKKELFDEYFRLINSLKY